MERINSAYDINRHNFDTGDIVLSSGRGAVSQGIKRFTFSRWSHVGMIIWSEELDALLIWESTTLSGVPDLASGQLVQGVQLVLLSQRVAMYDGEMAVRRLKLPDGRDPADFVAPLTVLRNQLRGRMYEESNLELIRSA